MGRLYIVLGCCLLFCAGAWANPMGGGPAVFTWNSAPLLSGLASNVIDMGDQDSGTPPVFRPEHKTSSDDLEDDDSNEHSKGLHGDDPEDSNGGDGGGVTTAANPEPGTVVLLAGGLAALVLRARKARRP